MDCFSLEMDDDINDIDLQFEFDDEEDDQLLAEVVEASVAAYDGNASLSEPNEKDVEDLANISVGIETITVKKTDNKYDSSGFDQSSGQLWIYPTNYPIRDYQYNIVQQALHRNTLVVLPTGLGKTFIAAVVMYNLYRWFPQGKVVFMAPTKPLVAQQIHACYTIVGIPKYDTVEMTGNMHPSVREKMWRQKRVIFLTPQVMTNDLSRGSFAATSIKCLVVDEAHKATGNHAYCQVVRELLNFTQDFRVLALSATPGSDLKKVQQVMSNLLIAHIELRSEESIDIRPYTHERKVDKIVVPMGEELSGIRLKYIQIMEMVVRRLVQQRVLYNREATKLSKFLILKARDEYRQNPPQNLQGPQYGAIEGDFATAMSLYHGFELLQLHGLRSLHNFLLGIQSGDKGYGRTRYELTRNPDFIDIMDQLQEKFASRKLIGKGDEKNAKVVVGHPKMQRLEEVVVEHFTSFQEKNMDTRVMIFSQYRDSVEEIRNILSQHQPLVKVMTFIGQSSVGKSTKGYSQKEQLKVMRQFREGGYNTLVSTCVGEEGLDIGDVDLIVCFDAHKSPIRLVQRMGRTGRKRMGRIVMLVTQGKEEQIYNQSLYSKKSIHKAIVNGAKTLHFYPHNPRLIPPGIKPKCHKMFITVNLEADTEKSSDKGKNNSGAKATLDNQSDISRAFSKARSKQSSSELSIAEFEEIRQEFSLISKSARHLPRPVCTVLSKNSEFEVDPDDNRAMLNLSEWTPWQNRLQQTHLVGHSSTTRNLVQTYEFIELMQRDMEESFIIKRKRKPTALLDFSSDNDISHIGKSSWLCAKGKSDQNKSHNSSKEKSKSFEEWQASCLDDVEEDNDFEVPLARAAFSKGKGKKSTLSSRNLKHRKKLKKGTGFIDEEADVSGEDGSSDEHEEDGDDCYEESFINSDTEMTQADSTDMKAIYLKSVKSPVGNPVQGRYRFQFNHASNTDIYSQALPEDQGMSEYEEDSFCVGSDEEDSPVVVKKAKKKKQKDKDRYRKKEKENKRRVRMLSNSSNEDDDDVNAFPFTQEFTTNHRAVARKVLMSSSEDENDTGDCVKNSNSNRTTNVVIKNNDSSDDSILRQQRDNSSLSRDTKAVKNVPFYEGKTSCGLSSLHSHRLDSVSETNDNVSKLEKAIPSAGAVGNMDLSNLDEWLDDFDAADINFDPKAGTLVTKNGNEIETQTPYYERGECDKTENISGTTCDSGSSREFLYSKKSSKDSKDFPGNFNLSEYVKSCKSSETNSINFRWSKQSGKTKVNAVAFVKPFGKNETCSDFSSNDVSSVKKDVTIAGRDLAREERLKRQKEKQERFRQKLAQVQQTTSAAMNVTKNDDLLKPHQSFSMSSIHSPAVSSVIASTHAISPVLPTTRETSVMSSTHKPSPLMSSSTHPSPAISSNTSVNTSVMEPLQILVDTREISGAQDVISALRLKHSITVTAKQIASCDYVLSNHLVVDRMYWSAFSNGNNRNKVTTRLCEMQALYRKCAIVIEADKVKSGQEKNRKHSFPHSKHLDRTMASIIQTGIKMYFTDSADQTASLLSELCQTEQRKGRHLAIPAKLNPNKEGMFNFVMSIPQVNIMEGLNLVHRYKNLAEIISSPAALLQKRGCLPSEKVQSVYNYLRHNFDPQMLPANHR